MSSTAQDWIELMSLCTRYSRGFDTRDYDLVLSCFVPDAPTSYDCSQLDLPVDVLTYATPEDLIADMRVVHAPLRGLQHRNSNHLFEIDGDRATGRVYVDGFQVRTDRGATETVHHIGWYDDVFVRTAGGWRFAERHCTLVWSEGRWLGAAPAEGQAGAAP
jgi:hypothetical protein